MDNQEIIKLLERYYLGQCTEQEKAWVETWYLKQPEKPLNHSIEELTKDLDEVEQHLIHYIRPAKRLFIWPRVAVAAAVLFAFIAGAYFLFQRQVQKTIQNQTAGVIAPGGNKATLKLADGQQISLTDAAMGTISEKGGQTIKKTSDGTIAYQGNSSSGEARAQAFNTITTPRGGQWSVVLPDGTKVKLDAASSITYPVSFGKVRQVEIAGQAYFEVVHNASWPFRVTTKDQVIEDIGTAFNVNAYGDEPATKTVLVEGAVDVFNSGADLSKGTRLRLKPGLQALTQNHQTTVSAVNTGDAIAWKDGYFRFSDENIESIMRKLSRWYDLDVEYQGNSSQVSFNGEIPRNTSLSEVLKVLEAAKIHFSIEGEKIIVKY